MQSTLSQFAHGEVSTPRKRRDIPFESVGLEGDENSDSNDWRGVGGDEDDGDKRQEDGNVDRDLKGMDAEEKKKVNDEKARKKERRRNGSKYSTASFTANNTPAQSAAPPPALLTPPPSRAKLAPAAGIYMSWKSYCL